jgi:hypothetical protein
MAPAVKVTGPVEGLTVTTRLALVVPHAPVAVTVIVAVPKKPASQFIIPVAGFIVPAAAGSTEYVIDVAFAAVAKYVSSGAFWQSVTAPKRKLAGPVTGNTVTVLVPLVVPHNPEAVAVIVAAPANAGSQSMTPVVIFIVPAAAGSTEYTIEVLLRAVVVYISSGASWQIVVPPAVNVTGPVSGLTVTSLSAEVTPQSPVAVAVMVAVPKKAASQFITPVAVLIEPAVAGRTVYTMPVLLRAVAIYVSFGASWQTVVAPARKAGVPVEGFTVTDLAADVLPQRPVAVAVIVAVPKNAASQSITPVAGSIDPAAAGRTEYTIAVLLSAVAV